MLTHQIILNLHRSDPSSRSEGQLFALIDHAGIPGLARKLVEIGVKYISLFENSRDEGALAAAPLLFQIDTVEHSYRQQALLTWICERGAFTSSVLFMHSPLSLQELAQRLAVRLDACLPDEMDVMLRFFDARTFEQLLFALTDQQKQAFLSVAHCWWFVDRRGIPQLVAATFLEADSPEIPLKLTQVQEGYLIQASEPDQVAELLSSGVPRHYEQLAPAVRHDFIVSHMRAARDIGVQATHEISLYCALALLYGEDFSTQSPWVDALGIVQSGKLNLTQAVQKVEEENELSEIV